jgi:mono/diheme cytochrome c family protein
MRTWRQMAPSLKTLAPTEAKEREMHLIAVEYEAAMRGRTAALVFSVALLDFAGGIATRARGAGQVHASDQPLSELERARLLAAGKELFMAECARCHDERGDKALKTGPPMNERGPSTDEIARAVNGRLRDKTPEERRAVTLYISSLIKIKDSEEKAAPKP